MKVQDVMTPDVISVKPETTVVEIAKLLVARSISAVPVIDDDNHPLGIVSEGDLMHRSELDTARRRSWWLRFGDTATLAADYAKANGLKAEDVMTRTVVTIAEDASLADAATRLEENRIKRMPVVRDGRIVGIVSRANLVRALATAKPEALPVSKSDRVIKRRLMAELESQPWAPKYNLNVIVHGGVVELWGPVTSEEERKAVRVAAERTPGVVAVEDHLIVQPLMQWE